MAKNKKMRPKISLIIPVRGRENLLQKTIDCAIAGAINEIEIIIVTNDYDGPVPIGKGVRVIKSAITGTGRARHVGVMAATAPIVVTVDGHVKLCEMWDDYVLEHFARRGWGKSIACGFVGGLTADFKVEREPWCRGAKICFEEVNASEVRPLTAKWHQNEHGAKIGAVMGAFYAFRRTWYAEIGQPWNLFSSWGCDEETISVASWISGGDCRLMDDHVISYHPFSRTPVIDYSSSDSDQIRRNRLALPLLFPFSPEDMELLFLYYPQFQGITLSAREREFADFHSDKKAAMQAYLDNHVDGYAAWKAQLKQTIAIVNQRIVPSPIKQRQARIGPPQRLEEITHEVCDRCDHVDPFVCYSTESRLRRYKCKFCGRKAWRPREGGRIQFAINN